MTATVDRTMLSIKIDAGIKFSLEYRIQKYFLHLAY